MPALARPSTIGAVPPPPPRPQRAPTSPPRSSPDRHVGPYELVGKIATGGMGVVYLCRHTGYGGFRRLMALKVMHSHLVRQSQFLGMFVDEARLAGRLHHPNAVGILDLQRSTRGPYVVMEYVEGCTLGQLLARNRSQRSPRLLLPILIDVLSGLHAAHNIVDDEGAPLGLVHRDVSPSNILVGIDGVARVTDFGIAKARARLTDTPTGTCKGKFSYAAPEQVSGGVCDARTDVFAAGVVLWNALTGKPLFRGATDAATINNVLQRPIPVPSSVGLRPPECFDEVCLRALQRDPAGRFQSAADMADALRAVASRHGLLGTPNEVGRWVTSCFGPELEARRKVIRASLVPSNAVTPLPTLPEIEVPDTEIDAVIELDHEPEITAAPPRRTRVVLLTALLAASALLAWSQWRGGPLSEEESARVRAAAAAAPAASLLSVGGAPATAPATAPLVELDEVEAAPAQEPRLESEPPAAAPAAAPERTARRRARPRRLIRRDAEQPPILEPTVVAVPREVSAAPKQAAVPKAAVPKAAVARDVPALVRPGRDGGAHAESLETPAAESRQRARAASLPGALELELEPNPYR